MILQRRCGPESAAHKFESGMLNWEAIVELERHLEVPFVRSFADETNNGVFHLWSLHTLYLRRSVQLSDSNFRSAA